MWNVSSTEPQPASQPPEEDTSLEFLLSLRPQPGCEQDGVCNECGLCEH